MAGSATTEHVITPQVDISREKYGQSLRIIRAARPVGKIAQANEVRLEFVNSNEELAFDDFMTSLTEMLGTDKEYGEKANIENVRHHLKVDGKARAKNGEAMVDVLQNGVDKARQDAKENPELEGQVDRDTWDVVAAEWADRLKPGMTLWGVSMAPKKDIKKHPKTFKALGYQEDLAYFQFYAASESKITAGSFSVIVKDVKILKEVLAEHGMTILEDTSDNEWLKHAKTGVMSADQAEAFIKLLRDKVHDRGGINAKRQSINEYTKGQEPKVRQIFGAYYAELSQATSTGGNIQFLKDFATTLLGKNIKDLDSDVRQELVRIANSSKFDDDSARTLNSVVLYATAEELRKGLPAFFRQKQTGNYNLVPAAVQAVYYVQDPRIIHNMLAGNVQAGVAAGREYGGCPGQIKLGSGSSFEEGTGVLGSLQEAYGGKGNESNHDKNVMKCVNCPKCRTYHEELRAEKGKFTCKNEKCGYSVPA